MQAEHLARAFAEDPAFAALFPHDRPAALADWFTAVIDVLGACAQARILTRGQAIGVWTTGRCEACSAALDDRLFAVLDRHGGPAAIEVAAAMSAACVPPPPQAWFLHWLGTDRQDRRAGHGSRLLATVLDEAAAAGTDLWTTTSNPGAVRFYTGLGICVVAERVVPGAEELTCWTLSSGCS